MEEAAELFYFTASLEGDGAWIQTKEYSVVNCMLRKIIIRKDCLFCPITSPFGLQIILKYLLFDIMILS
jgi:hypothetical protein